ncbi:macrophage migration inhibitory factor-like [Amphiura filiformis]|uniref:macrophage migration inhibitory factor-like n=1 Tax=Amphiura filiformis TaxID=82378 RepID=UPI003B215407
MPILQIFTNVPKASLPDGFVGKCSNVWGGLHSNWPKQYTCANVLPGQMMSFGGTQEPCALVFAKTIGKIGKYENKGYTEKLTELLGSIGVAKNRMHIVFEDLPRENVGNDGTTFAFKK